MSEPAMPVEKGEAAVPGHKPYVPDGQAMTEFTWSAVVVGSSLGIIFAASSLYLVLKVGMTVSASIPVSVLAITLFRALATSFGFRRATILENNIVQTAGSAGESIAFGVGVTMPALLLLGFDMDITRVMVVSILGGILGILAMIPLRRAFIVKLHGRPGQPGTLLYPEGTACAQVLISGEKGGTTGKTVFIGFGVAFLHKFVTEGMNLLMGTVRMPLTIINKAASFATEMASELLGVGYIIGFRTSAIMMAGAILGYLVIIPVIYFIGEHVTEAAIAPGKKLIRDMSIREIRDNYLLFIGAGCVASAGLISMARTLPMIFRSIQAGLTGLRGGGGANDDQLVKRRTEDDMSMRVVLFGSLGLIVLLALFLVTEVGFVPAILGAILVVLFGFLFVTVSARLTGEIGSSSNPISGMTTATLMVTCLIFLALGMTSSTDRVLALSIAAVVCIASSNGGTTAQSLKTGFLVGGTPKFMQYAILIGALTSALVIGGTLLAFNQAGTVYSQKPENVPSITLTPEQQAKLPQQRESYEGAEYLVWDTNRVKFEDVPELTEIKPGRYLVDPATGRLRWLKDPAIMGKLHERDDGAKVGREFDAPKTQVMGIIINGVLKRDLNWSMVLIGALIAIMLELCGIGALAFAVGVYVPIQYSSPIFLGGIIRWCIDKYQAKSQAAEIAAAGDDPEARALAEIEAIRKAETSPGVLLASGYIAGGSLAGVLLAFFAFNDDLTKALAQWQYREHAVTQNQSFDDATKAVARQELGLGSGELSDPQQKQVDHFADEIADINDDVQVLWTPVSKGTVLKLPKKDNQERTFTATEDTYLGHVAAKELGSEDKAATLRDLNNPLKLPTKLPDPAILEIGRSLFGVEDAQLSDEQKRKLQAVVRKLEKRADGVPLRWTPVVNGIALRLDKAGEDVLIRWVAIEKGQQIKLPEGKTYEAKANTFLGDVAQETLGSREKAGEILAINNILKASDQLPIGAKLKLPQSKWPALMAFGALIAFLLAVGLGKLLQPRTAQDEAT